MTTKSKYPELIANMADNLASLLREKGHDDDAANEIASTVAESVRQEFGGQLLYIPKGLAFDVDERAKEIYRKFDGTNQKELAVEFGHSIQHIYRILAQVRRTMRGAQRANG